MLIRPAAYPDETDTGIFPSWPRQWIESVHQSLKHPLGIEQPGALRPDGLFTRIVQRLLAPNAAIWHNWHTGADQKRLLICAGHSPRQTHATGPHQSSSDSVRRFVTTLIASDESVQ